MFKKNKKKAPLANFLGYRMSYKSARNFKFEGGLAGTYVLPSPFSHGVPVG
jgi:hypothetical protein